MTNRFWSKLLPALILAGALALSGCSSSKVSPADAKATAEAPQEKPPLKIPASFTSADEERHFLVKAVHDEYYEEAKPLLEKLVEKTPTADSYMLLGTARYNLNDYQGAIEAWSKAADLDTVIAAQARNNMGNALRDSGKKEEAATAYREALKLNAGYWQAAVNLADLLRGQGNLSEAIAVLEKAAANNKDVAVLSSLLTNYRDALNTTTGG